MDPKNIVDQPPPDVHSENVKEEFYKWFESRGLLSELRSHMRQLMVKALEESNKNGKNVRNRKSAASPKLQAINLLVVDYLFHEDYLYTVSVFASEAQILDSLPQYSRYVTETVGQRRWEPSSLPRFSAQETEDILDTLRLPAPGRDARQAMQAYLSGRDSLLTCVVRALASHQHHSLTLDHLEEVGSAPQEAECTYQLWSQEMQNLLLIAGVKLHHIKRMQQKWALTIEEERRRAVQEEEEATEERLRTELVEQLRAEQVDLRERRSRVELREQGLTSLADQLSAVHDDISLRLSQIQSQSNELQEREVRLEERLCRVQEREEQAALQASLNVQHTLPPAVVKDDQSKSIDSASESSLQASKDFADVSVQVCLVTEESSAQAQGVVAETQTADPVVTACTQTVGTEDQEQQTSACFEHDQQLILQLQIDRERINELQEENLELRAHALQQRHRIDELTNRAANLSSQLEDARVAITVLSGQESAVVVAPAPAPAPARPRTPPFIVPTFGYNTPQRQGAGEESLFTPRPQQVIPRGDGRRRPLRYAFSQNPTATSEESSPTDEVIHNARARIQHLEEESAAVQRSYQEFHTRLVTTDSVMFPSLGSSRIHDPLIRVRRREVLPFNPLSIIPQQFNRSFRPRQIETRDEGNEESSSDQALLYESGRIEHLTNSRRIYSQRNIRQFDRWKQFKKKFQKRDHCDQRRSANLMQSNTSSDDDEQDLRRSRRRHETNNTRKTAETQRSAGPEQQTCETQTKNEQQGNNLEKQLQVENTQSEEQFDNIIELNTSVIPTVRETPTSKNQESQQSAQDLIGMELRLKSEVERSVRLIESVRSLLGTQNNVNPPKSVLSNGSLAVESLPRDSSQDDVLITENASVLTVQGAKQVVYSDKEKTPKHFQEKDPSLAQTSAVEKTVKHNSSTIIVYNRNEEEDTMPDLLLQHANEEVEHEVEEHHPTPLTIPSLRLVSPGLNAEDWLQTVAVTSTEVAEQDSGDRATSSITSASDILRELNPLEKDSSDSVISTGWADDSRHSSDFWN